MSLPAKGGGAAPEQYSKFKLNLACHLNVSCNYFKDPDYLPLLELLRRKQFTEHPVAGILRLAIPSKIYLYVRRIIVDHAAIERDTMPNFIPFQVHHLDLDQQLAFFSSSSTSTDVAALRPSACTDPSRA